MMIDVFSGHNENKKQFYRIAQYIIIVPWTGNVLQVFLLELELSITEGQ